MGEGNTKDSTFLTSVGSQAQKKPVRKPINTQNNEQEMEGKRHLQELLQRIQESGEFLDQYKTSTASPPTPVVEMLIVIGNILENHNGHKNRFFNFTSSTDDKVTRSQRLWSIVRNDLLTTRYYENLCQYFGSNSFRVLCDDACAENCEGFPHIDPTVANYIKTVLEQKKINTTALNKGLRYCYELVECLLSYLGPSLLFSLTGGTGDVEDIILLADYYDDDHKIYFKEKDLIEYLFHIEDDNLFKINLMQDDEQALEEKKKSSQEAIEFKKSEIKQQQESITVLQHKLTDLKKKHEFYLSGRNEKTVKTYANALNEKLTDKGFTSGEIAEVNKAIGGMMKECLIPMEEGSDMIDLFKRAEMKFNFLVEWRKKSNDYNDSY